MTGSHTFKSGVQVRRMTIRSQSHGGNADLIQQYRNGVPDSVQVGALPFIAAFPADEVGVYAMDSWTIGRLTINPGLRFDRFTGGVDASAMAPGRFVPARTVEPSSPVSPFNDLSPRLSAVYDLFGNAKTALKISANKIGFGPCRWVGRAAERSLERASESLPRRPDGGGHRGADSAGHEVSETLESARHHSEASDPRQAVRVAAGDRGVQSAQLERGAERDPDVRTNVGSSHADDAGSFREAWRLDEVLTGAVHFVALCSTNNAASGVDSRSRKLRTQCALTKEAVLCAQYTCRLRWFCSC